MKRYGSYGTTTTDSPPGLKAKAQKTSHEVSPAAGSGETEMVMAVVSETFAEEGYSMLSDDPESETANFYLLLHEDCDAKALSMANAIAFEPMTTGEGTLQAAPGTIWVLIGKVEPGQSVGWGEQMGTVDRVAASGDAFINCDEVMQKYGHQGYAFSKVVQGCGLCEGREICFNVHVNARGQPQVSAPVWVKYGTGTTPIGAPAGAYGKGGASSKGGFKGAFGMEKGKGKGKGKGKAFSEADTDNELMKELARLEAMEKGGGYGASTPRAPLQKVVEGELSIAHVLETKPDKGFSFLTTDPEDPSAKVYIHGTVASPDILEQCQAVAFTPHISPKGEMQASSPAWLLFGKNPPENGQIAFGQFQGVIHRMSPSGDGYVDCPEALSQFGKEAYVFRKVMNGCQLQQGDEISFDLHVNDRNMPQVSAPVWKKWTKQAAQDSQRHGGMMGKGAMMGKGGMMGGMGMGMGMGAMGKGMKGMAAAMGKGWGAGKAEGGKAGGKAFGKGKEDKINALWEQLMEMKGGGKGGGAGSWGDSWGW